MNNTLRLAIASTAAIAVLGLAPAKADPVDAVAAPVVNASLPKVALPELLDQGEPVLTDKVAPTPDELESAKPLQESDQADDEPVDAGASLLETVSRLSGSDAGSAEMNCLATGIYFESKSESLAGQLAVGQVIANRSTSGRFPSSYCGVLFQRGQFSFIRGHSLPSVPRASKQWRTAVAMAKIVDRSLHTSSVGKALFFHARYVSPGWRLKRVATIGNHIFYR